MAAFDAIVCDCYIYYWIVSFPGFGAAPPLFEEIEKSTLFWLFPLILDLAADSLLWFYPAFDLPGLIS
jgi:hypothetical protein